MGVKEIASQFPCCPLNRKCLWKKNNNNNLEEKPSENQRFSLYFQRGYKSRTVICNGLRAQKTRNNCGALRDLVPFLQFKKHEKHPWRSVTFSRLQPATLLKVTLLHGCFLCFLNCAHGTKSRNTPQLQKLDLKCFEKS